MIAIQPTILILKFPTIGAVTGICVSQGCVFPAHIYIPRDVCFPTHISLGIRMSFSDMCFPTMISAY